MDLMDSFSWSLMHYCITQVLLLHTYLLACLFDRPTVSVGVICLPVECWALNATLRLFVTSQVANIH